jgi:hypothetical protein
MYVLTIMSAVPCLGEEGGIERVDQILSETRHRTWDLAAARARRGIRGQLVEWGENGWVPSGAMDYAKAHPGRAILVATIDHI